MSHLFNINHMHVGSPLLLWCTRVRYLSRARCLLTHLTATLRTILQHAATHGYVRALSLARSQVEPADGAQFTRTGSLRKFRAPKVCELQRVAVCCSSVALQWTSASLRQFQHFIGLCCCSMLQCVAMQLCCGGTTVCNHVPCSRGKCLCRV